MGRRTSLMLALCLGCAGLLLQSQPAVASSGPVITRFTDSGRFVDGDLCGYPIHVAWHENGRVYEWYDADGNLTRRKVHDAFIETAAANGKVARGADRETLTDNMDGSYVFTGSWIFFLPDGSHIQNAGRIQVPYDFSTILSDHGPHPIIEGHLADEFCPPMS
jgi:hypothetical protein